MKLAVLFTGGKDSVYATYLARKQGHQITCLITLKSENLYSYMFHTPAIELTELQAEAMGLPLITQATAGEKEIELKDLATAIHEARQKYSFDGIITGALFSDYQSSRIQKIAEELKLEVFSPLWHKPQKEEMQELLDERFKFIMTSIAAEGLDKEWLNKPVSQKELDKLNELNERFGLNVSGEGGEFETLVLDCPLFKKQLVLEEVKIIEESQNTARLLVKKAVLKGK
ncbi:diphthine--ammonia ligase [Candidatus Woesearchaeota archaeon]|nr:diphthine--ammonia ligase [Candidatus Woesearchaeota archaeon]